VPGIVLILVMGVLSTYSGLVLAEFHKAHPYVQNFGDAVEVLGKPIGMGRAFQEIFGWAQVIFQVFVMGSHLLTWTICMNTLTNSATCTVVWAVVGLGVFWVLNLPRTLKYTSWMSMACTFTPLPPELASHADHLSQPVSPSPLLFSSPSETSLSSVPSALVPSRLPASSASRLLSLL
jgi:hypothetical protein